MSDMRFVMIGIILVFVGIIVLVVFGQDYQAATLESNEFGTCFEYSDEDAPIEISCSFKIFNQTLFFAVIIGFIGSGIIALVKGAKGNWDSKVNPKDMVGPGRRENDNSEDPDKD